MSMLSVARQARPEVTLAVCRGACRLMRQAGHSVLIEVPLPDGRRADIFAVGRGGEITIVEVKSSIEDWRVDIKWPDYLDWCDQLYFAVPVDFPAGAHSGGDRADRGRRLWRRDPASSRRASRWRRRAASRC